MRTTTRALALLLITAWVGLGVAALPARAHSRLLLSSPADGATVPASPGELVLTFNEDINPEFVTVRVTDGEGGAVVDADATVTGPTVTVPVAQPIAAGSYKITYRVVSADSHPISGSTAFTIAGDPQASPSAAPSPSAEPPSRSASATPSTPQASPSPSAVAADERGTSGGTPLVVWVVGFGVLAAAVAATFHAIRRDRDGT
ncbi:copper resistance CopC family protein [Knoellia aerolata]|uniref:Copper resistance protein C n=1 Tax=Knoellia aerolata DSM 18566 TaxID=1385519 RepID=A0A0A0JTQ1_9MICO|nr:copper resistance CopC family protein [Knoellia aerolata]KGN40815.1 copper resistance protein C [Knoellia aerolata DSM 18566]